MRNGTLNGEIGDYWREIDAKKKESERKRKRELYHSKMRDPLYKEKERERSRVRMQDPVNKKKRDDNSKRRRKDPEYRKKESNWFFYRKYGITEEELNRMYVEQSGKCAICKTPGYLYKGTGKSLCIDHNHVNGSVRGLLCVRCNTKLSVFENKEWERSAREYLRKYS